MAELKPASLERMERNARWHRQRIFKGHPECACGDDWPCDTAIEMQQVGHLVQELEAMQARFEAKDKELRFWTSRTLEVVGGDGEVHYRRAVEDVVAQAVSDRVKASGYTVRALPKETPALHDSPTWDHVMDFALAIEASMVRLAPPRTRDGWLVINANVLFSGLLTQMNWLARTLGKRIHVQIWDVEPDGLLPGDGSEFERAIGEAGRYMMMLRDNVLVTFGRRLP